MKKLRIGSRGSKLALAQAQTVKELLQAQRPGLDIEIVVIKTSGDWKASDGEMRLSAQAGGKGLFIKEIEQALVEERIDCGVHSLKDVPSQLPPGLAVDHVLEREDPRDVFISYKVRRLEDLPGGAVVGTSSVRRHNFLLRLRGDIEVTDLRGNVTTRLEKLRSGQVDAAILALAGLKRLGLDPQTGGLGENVGSVIEPGAMLPACGQGIVAIETRALDNPTRALLDSIHCRVTGLRAVAEREALVALGGSCHTPIGAHAVFNGKELSLRVAIPVMIQPGEKKITLFEQSGAAEVETVSQARQLGISVGQALRAQVEQDRELAQRLGVGFAAEKAWSELRRRAKG